MKLIIAHLPSDEWESVRTELLDLGVLRTTISQVHSSGPQSDRTLHDLRGAEIHTHLRAELRLELVAAAEQAPAIVELLRGHVGTRWGLDGRVAVLDIEGLHRSSQADLFDDAEVDSAIR